MIGIYDHIVNEVTEDTLISASLFNTKVGNIIGINLLSGESPYIKKDGTVLTTVKGTCCGCCKFCEKNCYARDYTLYRHITCLPSYIKNTTIMRNNLQNYVDQIVDICEEKSKCRTKNKKKKFKYCRYHESGEFETFLQMVGVEDVAIRVPQLRYYFYSKRFDWMERIEESGGFSDNVSPLASIWYDKEGKRNYDNPYNFAEFIYDDGSVPELDNIFHCPAVFIDGTANKMIVCEQCGRCPNAKKGMKTAVYAHGKKEKWYREGVDIEAIAREQKAKWEKIKIDLY